MRILTILSSLIITLSIQAKDTNMMEIPGKRIFIDQLENMFSNISEKTDWDMSSKMLWGYFFTHHEPNKLEEIQELLVKKGYRFVDIFISDKENANDPDLFWLHVEKIEAHSPKSLDERNNEFYLFAHEHSVDSYDGMDVGPVKQ